MDFSPASVPSCFSQLSVRKAQGLMLVRDHISKCLNSHMKLCLVCKATCSIANKRHLTKPKKDTLIYYLHRSCTWHFLVTAAWILPVCECLQLLGCSDGVMLNKPGGSDCPESSSLSLQFVIICSSQSKAVPICTWSATWLCSPVRCLPLALLGQSPFPRVPYLLRPGRAWATARAAEQERNGCKTMLDVVISCGRRK